MNARTRRRYVLLALVLGAAAFGGHRLYAQRCFSQASRAVVAKRALTDEEKAAYLEGLRDLPTIRLFDLEDYLAVDATYVASLFEDALQTRAVDRWTQADIEKLAQWGGRFQQASNHLLAAHCFKKCLELVGVKGGKSAQWHLFAGQNFKLAGLEEEAIVNLKEAAALDPNDYRPRTLLANAYAERFDHTGSRSDLMLACKYAQESLKLKADQPKLDELHKKLVQRVADEASIDIRDEETPPGTNPEEEFRPKIPNPVPKIGEPVLTEPGPGDGRRPFKNR
ncbi:MAG: hypothetical protein AB7F75_01145 [Planctomycetota bacterium]